MLLCALSTPASAFLFGWGDPPWYSGPRFPGGYEPRERKAKPRRLTVKRPPPITEAERKKQEELVAQAKGKQLLIAISLSEQRMVLYADGVEIARSPISSGTARNPTPAGIFSIIQKRRFHRSNLYSNAPMPYMQRLTWDGVALHQGVLPGYPASHGCIRLPEYFARTLFVATATGARVTVTHGTVTPQEFAHPRLPTLKPKVADAPPPAASLPPRADSPAAPLVKVASAATVATDAVPVPGVATEADADQFITLHLAITEPPAGASAAAAPSPAPRADPPPAPAQAAVPIVAAPEPSAPTKPKRGQRTAEKTEAAGPAPLRPGPITVFVSRKESKLYVRKGFAPVFDVPVVIDRPNEPFGTHLLNAVAVGADETTLRWTAMSMPSNPRTGTWQRPAQGKGRQKGAPAAREASSGPAVPGAARALERITIPAEALDRIGDLMTPGASFIITDHGIGTRTGRETDFIVVTR